MSARWISVGSDASGETAEGVLLSEDRSVGAARAVLARREMMVVAVSFIFEKLVDVFFFVWLGRRCERLVCLGPNCVGSKRLFDNYHLLEVSHLYMLSLNE